MKNTYYVAVDGKDTNAGTLDNPFRTLARARDAVRKLKATTTEDIAVLIRGGIYVLDETVVFGLDDSAADGQTITYAAYPDEIPVFSSGASITGWRLLDDDPDELPEIARGKVWVADIPAELGCFKTLFDGSKRLERSRSDRFAPTKKSEYIRAASQNVEREEDRHLLRRLDYPEGAIRDWPNLSDIEVGFTPVPWTANLLPLAKVDEANCVATLAREATAPLTAKNPHGVWVENAIDHLNEPGRWALDTLAGKLYLWPEGDEPGDGIVAPQLKEFIRVEGDIDYDGPVDAPVCGLVFRGLTFTHGERDTWAQDHKGWGIQHDWDMFDRGTALVRFRGAEDCAVTECHFTNSGGSAVRLDLHCRRIRVESNLIARMGHMGVLLCGYGPGTKDVNCDNDISNNLIHHCGEVIWHGHAIFLWQSGSNRIANNVIHHTARKAIGLCGVRVTILEHPEHTFDEASKTIRWDEINAAIAPDGDNLDRFGDNFDRFMPFLHTRDNIVENNEVYRALEKLGDGSAINVSGAAEDNVLRRNYAHHIASYDCSSVMRVDDWQRGTTFVDNIVYMSNVGALTRKNLNHIENNIFADCSVVGVMRFASYPDEKAAYGSRIQRNIFYESGSDVVYYKEAYLASPDVSLPQHCAADNNVFYCAGDPSCSEKHIADWREQGIEQHSVSADPLFVDIENGDFRLKPDSPALGLGFEQIDMSLIGLRDDFPQRLRDLDEPDDGSDPAYARGRDTDKEAYAWW